MTLKFLKHRAVIEPIEDEVQKLLGKLNIPLVYNQSYKDFVRECYSAIKKLTTLCEAPSSEAKMQVRNKESTKNVSASSAINMKLNQLIEKWVKKGLKWEILEKVKEVVYKY
jgi:hypothetical protein